MRSLFVVTLVCALLAPSAHATDIAVTNPTMAADATSITFHIEWQNSWRTDRNHDAAWVVIKASGAPAGNARHAAIRADGHTIKTTSAPPGEIVVPQDRAGVFIRPAAAHRGTFAADISLSLEPPPSRPASSGQTAPPTVIAIEMVSIPEGPFYLGDTSESSRSFASFFKCDAAGKPADLYHVTSESEIAVGPRAGALDYQQSRANEQYEGDRLGPVPAAFPKGFRSFYIMKYELSQGQYAAFLNTLPEDASNFRAIHGSNNYAALRGTISCNGKRFIAASPNAPCNFVSWDDAMAFTDWAALRPMTELEFTKACRGTSRPVPADYPWGTNSKDRLKRTMDDAHTRLAMTSAADEATLTDETRDIHGASYYWVMDLAGSLWERCITIGHPAGRAFTAAHGDGRLGPYGFANVENWPKGDVTGGGYGYRGGGYYEAGHTYRDFNPHSPVEQRRFGSWGQGPRSKAYGYRAVRTAP